MLIKDNNIDNKIDLKGALSPFSLKIIFPF